MRHPSLKIVFLSFFVILVASHPVAVVGQDSSADDGVSLISINLNEAIMDYEDLTGFKVITDLNTVETPINIDSRGVLSRQDAVAYLEKSFILNDFILVPSGDQTLKLISAASTPRAEGVPILTNPGDLVGTDVLVTYIMHFSHVPATEAMASFTSITSNHSYGQMTVLPDGMTLAITENSSVILRYIELKEYIDVPVEERVHKSICLQRSRATEVAEQLSEFLNIGSSVPSGGSAGGSADGGAATASAVGSSAFANNRNSAIPPNGRGHLPRITRDPRITAIDRTNSILVMAHPSQLPLIEKLICEFDAPASQRNYMTVRLKYMSVLEILDIAQDALTKGGEEGEAAARTSSTTRTATRTNTATTNPVTNNNSFNSDGSFSTNSSRSRTGGASLAEPTNQGGAQSITVGETLLIADPGSNELFVSGPPEQLCAIENLVKQIDKKPRQIYLSTVIGQLTLGNNIQSGIDLFQTSEFGGALQSSGSGIFDNTTLGDLVPGSGLNFYGLLSENLGTYVNLLETDTRFKVVQRPSVFATNNEKAVIQTGQRIAIPTSSIIGLNTGTTTSNIQYEDVVLRLEVIPLINSNDEVTLTISQVNDNIVGFRTIDDNDIPTIGTQELVTKVIVPNKATVLLGGLISEDMRDTDSGVPGLVHVPLLKRLAGSVTDERNRQELLIFIQPHIITDGADLADANISNAEGLELLDQTDHIVQPGPIEKMVGPGKPYVFSRKVRPVEEKKFPKFQKLFSRKKVTPQVYSVE